MNNIPIKKRKNPELEIYNQALEEVEALLEQGVPPRPPKKTSPKKTTAPKKPQQRKPQQRKLQGGIPKRTSLHSHNGKEKRPWRNLWKC